MIRRKILRVACYVRVSTEEQKKNGFSVATQIDDLTEYVKAHNDLVLVDFYVDDGVSAVKVKKRLELQRLLQDVKDGKIDLILFTKLDRWGRDVGIYYQIQSVLDQYNCAWQAIHEDYEIQSSAGKFKVNIMMSVAQQERDKGSERIKDVFNFKAKKHEPLTGAMPKSHMIQEIDGKKRIVINKKNEPMIRELIDMYKSTRSIRQVMMYAQSKYEVGEYPQYQAFGRLLRNPFLCGEYRGIIDYCEAYMTRAEFDEIQAMLDANVRFRQDKNTYIFQGLLVCPVCGGKLAGNACKYKKIDGISTRTLSYRCGRHAFTNNHEKCTFNKAKIQSKLESAVLDVLQPTLNNFIMQCESQQQKPVKKVDVSKIKDEMDRLNKMFLKGRIQEDDYDKQYAILEAKIKEATQATKPQISVSDELKSLQGLNVEQLYNSLTDEEKQAFMRGIVKEIRIDEEFNIKDIIFLG